MRIFKSKAFAKFARKEDIRDTTLAAAARDAENGKIDADYGGGVIKQRIARPNEGKSGGYRVVLLYLQGEKAFFLHGFAKHEKANLSKQEERFYKDAAKIVLRYSDAELAKYVADGIYTELLQND